MTDVSPTLNIPAGGWVKCKRCPKKIVFAPSYTTGKTMPLELDPAGEWTIADGYAKHIGPPAVQLELGAAPGPTRWTSHFARCPAADTFRRK